MEFHHFHGIDFSGAQDAGRRIWISTGVVKGRTLYIGSCSRAESLPESSRFRDDCLSALFRMVQGHQRCVFGCDFPFGLPSAIVKSSSWQEFAISFRNLYPSAREFRETCRRDAGGHELKRVTDCETKTPMCAYNLRLYPQTYYGIRDFLSPLLSDGAIIVSPMQSYVENRALMLEICPASTLKHERIYRPYKGNTIERVLHRVRILDYFEKAGVLAFSSDWLRKSTLDDQRGDALDSVIAAVAAFRACTGLKGLSRPDKPEYAIEGYVYV
jgi:hypothetical protein